MRIAKLIILSVLAVSAQAASITYVYQGDQGFTGFFTLDSSAIPSGDPFAEVPQSALTAFSFSGPGFSFEFSDVNVSSSILFDSTLNPPAYFDGAGDAADDAAGNAISFFPDGVQFEPAHGDFVDSQGTFVVAPEPASATLLIGGVTLCFVMGRRRNRART